MHSSLLLFASFSFALENVQFCQFSGTLAQRFAQGTSAKMLQEHLWLTDTLDTKPATNHAPTWTFGPILCQNLRRGSLKSASCLVRQFQCQERSSPTPCSTWSQRLAAISVSPLDSPWCTFSCRSRCFGNKFCTGPSQKMRVVCLHRNRALDMVT